MQKLLFLILFTFHSLAQASWLVLDDIRDEDKSINPKLQNFINQCPNIDLEKLELGSSAVKISRNGQKLFFFKANEGKSQLASVVQLDKEQKCSLKQIKRSYRRKYDLGFAEKALLQCQKEITSLEKRDLLVGPTSTTLVKNKRPDDGSRSEIIEIHYPLFASNGSISGSLVSRIHRHKVNASRTSENQGCSMILNENLQEESEDYAGLSSM